MTFKVLTLILFALSVVSCGENTPDSLMPDSEYERQIETYDRQAAIVDWQLKVADEQAKRFDSLMDRWEQQADRKDKILDAWEEKTGMK